MKNPCGLKGRWIIPRVERRPLGRSGTLGMRCPPDFPHPLEASTLPGGGFQRVRFFCAVWTQGVALGYHPATSQAAAVHLQFLQSIYTGVSLTVLTGYAPPPLNRREGGA